MLLIKKLSNFIHGLLSLIFPFNCPICHSKLESKNKNYICIKCWKEIKLIKGDICSKCGRLSALSICSLCKKNQYYFNRARAAGIYEGALREYIHMFKYKKKTYLAEPLGKLLSDMIENDEILNKSDLLIPIPLDTRRYREREFNQAYLLADVASRRVSIPVSTENLRRTRVTLPQTGLNRKQREKNVKNIFQVNNAEEFKDKNIIVIDDVFTTGATVNACAKALRKSGSGTVNVVTVARRE